MFQNKKVLASVGVVAVILIAGLVFYFLKNRDTEPKPVQTLKKSDLPCPNGEKEYVMQESQMAGLVQQGQKFKVIENWYACHPVEKGDLVYYQFSSSHEPVVRVVRAVTGDKFEVLRDKKISAWNIKINGDLLEDSSGKPYYFGSTPPATLSLYKGVLADGDLVLFSNVPPGGKDSGIFGVTNVADIVGKVEPIPD